MNHEEFASKIPLNDRGKVRGEIWFPTLFHFVDLLNYEERNKKWLKHIYKWRDDDNRGIVRSNSRGWHSAVDMHTREEYVDMGKEALKVGQQIHETLGLNPKTEPVIDNMWANVSQFGAHNRNHTHPGSHFSFVYIYSVQKIVDKYGFLTLEHKQLQFNSLIIQKNLEREKHLMKYIGLRFQAD